MNEALKKLLEERDSKSEALQALVDTVEKEERKALTDQENETRSKLVEEIKSLDKDIDDQTAKAQRGEALSEARRLAGISISSGDTRVVEEPKTYGHDSPHQYFGDLARAHLGPLQNGYSGAVERLQRHSYEMAKEARLDTKEGRSAMVQMRELSRGPDKDEHRDAMRRFRAAGESEQRTAGLTTGGGATVSASGGGGAAMVIPPVFTDSWVPFRTSGRTFLDAIHHEPLPESGMSIYVPALASNATVAAYDDVTTQTVSETTPTLTMLSSAVSPQAGQVEVTQVMLDRGSVPTDQVIADSLRRVLAPALDTYALTQALSGAGSIVDNSTAWAISKASAVGGLIGKLEQSKSIIRQAAGTFLDPNAVFFTPTRLGQIFGAADSTGRLQVVPTPSQGPFNSIATPSGNTGNDVGPGATGRTGYQMAGLEVFQDYNIPAPASGADQAIVLDTQVVYAFEGTPVPRVVPQTKANVLIVYIQLYTYIAVLPIYPLGVEKISGTFMGAASWA